MLKNNLLTALFLSFIICIALIPTLLVTEIVNQLPFPLPLIFIIFPILTAIGITIAEFIAKKVKILLQVAKFALVGVSNTAIDFGILNLLISITGITSGVGIIPINAVSFVGALLNSYFWNKKWVFGEGKRGNFIVFVVVTIIGMSINTGIVYLLTTHIPPLWGISSTLWANFAKVIATGVSLFWNFTGYKLIVFKK